MQQQNIKNITLNIFKKYKMQSFTTPPLPPITVTDTTHLKEDTK
jgi:hypothetical protein